MAASHYFLIFSLLFLSIQTHFIISQANVPQSDTFTHINEGEHGPYINEYDASYRPLPVTAAPFQLCFYNTTPNAYYLALRMGAQRQEPVYRWVWEANRGNPVRENATFSLGTNGNLVLADSNGRIAWQSGTANKNVVGFQLLPNGNMVLRDSAGKFVWQSFDYPTDTLLVGQSLRIGATTKLVSRISEQINDNGPYSMVMEPNTLAFYYKNLIYYNASNWFTTNGNNLTSVTFYVEPDNIEESAYRLQIISNVTNSDRQGTVQFARPNYNVTLSFLRLYINGNLRIYTYYNRVDYRPWEVTFRLFARNTTIDTEECALPERCGEFGLCEDNQCVACPMGFRDGATNVKCLR